ncbi:hypothetical protein GCM10008967_37770 [Bacillus carboniphilus]|uniref:Uncharacterized protein n=1 Tax=Bacillus carboniphilus TaxID=86663 RepID=A0ABN0WPX5_9BACI
MKPKLTKHMNIWSFVFSFICLIVFLSGLFPLDWVLYMAILNLFLGVIGLAGIQGWSGMLRSITTIILTIGLTAVITSVLTVGGLFN